MKMIMQYWACPAPKEPAPDYHYYCGSCGCKYYAKPRATRPACESNCTACGSSRILKAQIQLLALLGQVGSYSLVVEALWRNWYTQRT